MPIYIGGGEAFDSYEEGTWTPVFTTISDSKTFVGRYTKVGDLVRVHIQIWTDTLAATNVKVTGFPFSSDKIEYITLERFRVTSGTGTGQSPDQTIWGILDAGGSTMGLMDQATTAWGNYGSSQADYDFAASGALVLNWGFFYFHS
tara:strand:- start:196 stop:633 length:438 start_codon:yes stop_codon:yes gene_type:complete